MRIREIAAVRVRYGYKRIHVLLQREGWEINHKRVYRLYCEEGLNLRRKRSRKRKSENLRETRESVQHVNDCWGMDFASDSTFQGRRFRVLTIVDLFSRECLGLDVDQGIQGDDVVSLLNHIKSLRGVPKNQALLCCHKPTCQESSRQTQDHCRNGFSSEHPATT